MSSHEVPERWAARLKDRGFTRRDGGPNVSAFARTMGVSIETARRLVLGIGDPEPDTIRAASEVLGADVQDWIGRRVDLGPYEPPRESAMLTSRQRRALTEMIRSMVDDEARAATSLHDVVPPPAGEADRVTLTDDVEVDPEDHVLAARDADDDDEAEAQQGEV